MKTLKQIAEEKYPYGKSENDSLSLLEEIKVDRLRVAFESGARWAMSQFIGLVPSEDKGREGCTYGDTKFDSLSVVYGYNTALEHVIQNYETLYNSLNEE